MSGNRVVFSFTLDKNNNEGIRFSINGGETTDLSIEEFREVIGELRTVYKLATSSRPFSSHVWGRPIEPKKD